MAKTIKLTESDLERIIERVISEQDSTERELRNIEKSLIGKTFTTRNNAIGQTHGAYKIKSVNHSLDKVNKTPEALMITAEGVDVGGRLDIEINCSGKGRIFTARPQELKALKISPKLVEWAQTNWCPKRGNRSGQTDF